MTHQPRYRKGDRIGDRYLVHQALMGGMGEVYLCLDLEQNKPYALKTFRQHYLGNPAIRRLFVQEVSTWMTMEKHPNIVRCHYLDTLDNQPFIVLEWVTADEGCGTDLRSWLRNGPLELRIALDIIIDICYGLIHAQAKQPGLVHCDLKPENVLIGQGRQAKITDFGLAHVVQQGSLALPTGTTPNSHGRHHTQRSGNIVGTPPYMAPEQWQGVAIDQRTDIYAVGCILYELLTGQFPFRATTSIGFAAQHIHAPIPHIPDSLYPSSVLNHFISTCLAKKPTERYKTLTDALNDVRTYYHQLFGSDPGERLSDLVLSASEYANRGTSYWRLGLYKEALADINQAIQLNPINAMSYNNRGNTYLELGRYEEALIDYDHAIRLDPSIAMVYTNRGATKLILKRHKDALTDHNQAIQLNPTNSQAYNNRGNTYLELGRHQEALSDFDYAIQINPTNAQAHYNRGNTYSILNQYTYALSDYNQAIKIDPTIAEMYYNRGLTHFKLYQYPIALSDFDQAILLNPNDAQSYYNRGTVYEKLNYAAEALADFDQAILLAPDMALAYLSRGAILANRRQLRLALTDFEQATRLGNPAGHEYAVRVRQMLGLPTITVVSPARHTFDAFLEATTLEAMRQAVAQYPFMVDPQFVAAVGQLIVQQVPPEQKSTYEQRLTWLRKLANTSSGTIG